MVGSLKIHTAFCFYSCSPTSFQSRTLYTQMHITGSMLTHAASKSPHLSCRIIHWTTLTLGYSSRVQSRSKALTIHEETCTITLLSMTTMLQKDRAKTSSTTELTHIWTQCRPPPAHDPPTRHTKSIKRLAPHGTYSMPGVQHKQSWGVSCGRGWERKTERYWWWNKFIYQNIKSFGATPR